MESKNQPVVDSEKNVGVFNETLSIITTIHKDKAKGTIKNEEVFLILDNVYALGTSTSLVLEA